MDETLKTIKEIVLNTAEKFGIGIDKVILFGSRARGDYTLDSDWDILVVTKEKIGENVKYGFINNVRKEIVWKLDLPIDVLVIDSEYLSSYKDVYGSIAGMVTLEGNVI